MFFVCDLVDTTCSPPPSWEGAVSKRLTSFDRPKNKIIAKPEQGGHHFAPLASPWQTAEGELASLGHSPIHRKDPPHMESGETSSLRYSYHKFTYDDDTLRADRLCVVRQFKNLEFTSCKFQASNRARSRNMHNLAPPQTPQKNNAHDPGLEGPRLVPLEPPP